MLQKIADAVERRVEDLARIVAEETGSAIRTQSTRRRNSSKRARPAVFQLPPSQDDKRARHGVKASVKIPPSRTEAFLCVQLCSPERSVIASSHSMQRSAHRPLQPRAQSGQVRNSSTAGRGRPETAPTTATQARRLRRVSSVQTCKAITRGGFAFSSGARSVDRPSSAAPPFRRPAMVLLVSRHQSPRFRALEAAGREPVL
jgi:hypothetical protein